MQIQMSYEKNFLTVVNVEIFYQIFSLIGTYMFKALYFSVINKLKYHQILPRCTKVALKNISKNMKNDQPDPERSMWQYSW